MEHLDPIENRKASRFPLSRKEGVYCVIYKADVRKKTMTLAVLDFSEKGFRFMIKAYLESDFSISIGEKLFLIEIIGTRNVKFENPIELIVRWKNKDNERIDIGCEIIQITTNSRKQFIAFIEAEASFIGMGYKNQIPMDSINIIPLESISEPEHRKSGGDLNASQRAVGYKYWLIGMSGGFLILLSAFLFILHSTGAFTERLNRIENDHKTSQTALKPAEEIEAAIKLINARINQSEASIQKSNNQFNTVEKRIAELEQKISRLESLSVSKKSSVSDTKVTRKSSEPNERYHVVQQGENLFRISMKYNVSLERLAEMNGMKPNDNIRNGQKIIIP